MNFQSIYTKSVNHFFYSFWKSRFKNARSTRIWTRAYTHRGWQTGPGVSGTPPVSGRGRRAALTMANLAAGEVSGEEVYSIALSFARRTYWCSYCGQWRSGASSPASMVVWWPDLMLAGHLRPRWGAGRGLGAPPCQGGAWARENRERGGAKRGSPQSGALQWARPLLQREIPEEGKLPMAYRGEHGVREVEAELWASTYVLIG